MASKKLGVLRNKMNGGANLGFEAKLWQAADKLRGHMDAADYKDEASMDSVLVGQ